MNITLLSCFYDNLGMMGEHRKNIICDGINVLIRNFSYIFSAIIIFLCYYRLDFIHTKSS